MLRVYCKKEKVKNEIFIVIVKSERHGPSAYYGACYGESRLSERLGRSNFSFTIVLAEHRIFLNRKST